MEFLNTKKDKTLRALQKTELEALKEIDRICRKHDIKYSLGGGTCLGQVRHGGFIPWDDDIDVDMTYVNYVKFMEVAPGELDPEKFFLRCRQTDKKHLRSSARLEIKGTHISDYTWDKAGLDVGVFVDIVCICYLPNNKLLRYLVSSTLFYCSVIEHYKMFGMYAQKASNKLRPFIVFLANHVPYEKILRFENKLRRRWGEHETDWLIDDTIINGNYHGYPSEGLNEYEDVKFENLIVMNKKNTDFFLTILYGKNYKKWLPYQQRIIENRWIKFDLGEYAKKFDAPPGYEADFVSKYNNSKLEKMQELSFKMAAEVDRICESNNLNYYIIGINAYLKGSGLDDNVRVWREPLRIAMPKADYDKFRLVATDQLGASYAYLTYGTNDGYNFTYDRIVLKDTRIRISRLPLVLNSRFNMGLYIDIIPLIETSNNEDERIVHAERIKKLNEKVMIKWELSHPGKRKNAKRSRKKKYYRMTFTSLNTLIKQLDEERIRYSVNDGKYYIDGSGTILPSRIVDKVVFGKGQKLEFEGRFLRYPESLDKYAELTKDSISRMGVKRKYIYSHCKEEIDSTYISNIQKMYEWCDLAYYDSEDRQLSVSRYDETSGEFLSNDEITSDSIDAHENNSDWNRQWE